MKKLREPNGKNRPKRPSQVGRSFHIDPWYVKNDYKYFHEEFIKMNDLKMNGYITDKEHLDRLRWLQYSMYDSKITSNHFKNVTTS